MAAVVPKRRKFNKKVRLEMVVNKYIQHTHRDKVKIGEYYEELRLKQKKEHRVKWISNDVDDDYVFDDKLKPFNEFKEMTEGDPLHSKLHKNIMNHLHNSQPTVIQSLAMPHIIKREYDVMIRSEAGSGKTIAYAYPIVYDVLKAKKNAPANEKMDLFALIVVPNGELCLQVAEDFLQLASNTGLEISLSRPGVTISEVNALKQSRGINILVCEVTHLQFYFLDPEDLYETNKNKWSLKNLRYVVLDEAYDLIGCRFESFKRVDKIQSNFFKYIQPLGISLYLPDEELNQDYRLIMASTNPNISEYEKMPYRPNGCVYIEIGDSKFSEQCIEQRYFDMTESPEFDKKDKLMEVLESLRDSNEDEDGNKEFPRTIIFVNESDTCDAIANIINAKFDEVVSKIAEGMSEETRMGQIDHFKKFHTSIMVTTDLLSKGVDFSIDYLINYNLPETLDIFAQRLGRIGRLGNQGVAISFFDRRKDSGIAFYLDELNEKNPAFFVADFIKEAFRTSKLEKEVKDAEPPSSDKE